MNRTKIKAGRHPGFGERRRKRQPFGIEKLPIIWQDWIKEQRAIPNVTPWEEIERRSATALPWKDFPKETLQLFPRRYLPASNIRRWYDVACIQVQRENEAQRQSSVAVANSLLGGGYKNLPESVRTALGDQVFQLNRAVRKGDQDEYQARLIDLGKLLTRFQRNEIARFRAKAESKRVDELVRDAEAKRQRFEKTTDEAARKIRKGGKFTVADINRIREQTFGLPPIERKPAVGHSA